MNKGVRRFGVACLLVFAVVFSVMVTSLPMQADAAYRSGLTKVKGNTCYYKNNKKLKKKWKKVKKYYYYFDKKGKAYKNKVVKIGKYYYGFDKKCRNYRKKLVTIKGKKYYFDGKGKAAVNCYKVVNDKLYYFGAKGVCDTAKTKAAQAVTKEGTDITKLMELFGQPKAKVYVADSCWRGRGGSDYYYTYNGFKVVVSVPADKTLPLLVEYVE